MPKLREEQVPQQKEIVIPPHPDVPTPGLTDVLKANNNTGGTSIKFNNNDSIIDLQKIYSSELKIITDDIEILNINKNGLSVKQIYSDKLKISCTDSVNIKSKNMDLSADSIVLNGDIKFGEKNINDLCDLQSLFGVDGKSYSAKVNTKNALPKTIIEYADLVDGKIVQLLSRIVGISENKTLAASFIISGTFRKNGPIIQVGETAAIMCARDDVSFKVTYDISGQNILLQVIGKNEIKMNWQAIIHSIVI